MNCKGYISLVFIISVVFSCGSDNSAEIRKANFARDSVIELTKAKDTIIAGFMNSLNQIKRNLIEIQKLESEVADSQKNNNVIYESENLSLTKEMKTIKNLMDLNQKALTILNMELNKAKFKIALQNKKIVILNTELLDKTIELEKLYNYLLIKNKTITELNALLKK